MTAKTKNSTRGLVGLIVMAAAVWLVCVLLCLGELEGKASLVISHQETPLVLAPQKTWPIKTGPLDRVSFPARLQVFLAGEKEAVYLILASGSSQRVADSVSGRTLEFSVKEPPGAQGLVLKNLGSNQVRIKAVRLQNFVASSPKVPRMAVMMGSGEISLPPARALIMILLGLALCLLLAAWGCTRCEAGLSIWHGLAFLLPPFLLLAADLICQALGLHLELTWESFLLIGLITPGMVFLPRISNLWRDPDALRNGAVAFLVLVCFAGVTLAGFKSERGRAQPGGMGQLLHLGEHYLKDRSFLPDEIKLEKQGYDGQFFFYMSQDPLARKGAWVNIDSPSYRYQRILLPVIMYGLTGGDRNTLPAAMILFNITCLLGCLIVVLYWLKELGASRLWAMFLFFNYGVFYPAFVGLSEPLANFLLLLSLYWIWDEKPGRAAWCMSLMVLAKEYYVILPAAAFIWALFSKQKSRMYYLTPLLVAGLWQAAVYWRFGVWSIEQSAGNFSWPLLGLINHMSATPYLSHVFFCLAVLLLLGVILWQWIKGPRSEELVLLSLFLLLPLMAGPSIWASENGFMRVFSPAYLLYVLVLMGERTPVLALGALPFAVHAVLQIMHY